jgi:primary-amine oxidase
MIVPYGDPRSPNHRKNAFDAGEDGLGRGCHSLQLGCDCVGSIYYFDTVLVDVGGAPYTVPNAICLHEEDFGTLWKHKDWRSGTVETRRSRRLVVSFFTTIANYDYGFYWYFFQDGHITFEAKLTGILNTSAIKTGEHPGGYGTMVGPNLYAPIHQHFFISRLDMQVDGNENVFQEVNVYRPEPHEPNPYKSAFYVKPTTFKTELEAQRIINPFTARAWKVVNLKSKNRVGTTCGWKIVPLNSAPSFALDDSKILQRAGFLKKNILVTPYHPDEKSPAGEYVYAKEVDDGLTKWTRANRNIYNTDIVVWYIFGTTHVCRSEDWPVMPTEYAGFTLKPDNFFDISPAMDVPPTPSKVECCTVEGEAPRAKL